MVEVSFLAGVDQWIGVLDRLRVVVRQELVASQLAEVLRDRGIRRARVLDVGCGQGTQALALARTGHHVVGLDPSTELLARFQASLTDEPDDVRDRVELVHGTGESAPELTRGSFEVILCHGVIGYIDNPAPLLQALSQVAADDATLSLLVRNGLAPAMREGLRGHFTEALAAFDSRDYTRLGVPAHIHTPTDLNTILTLWGWQPGDWYGVRVFTDDRDDITPDSGQLQQLLALEREAGRRDPYRHVADLLHLSYQRNARPVKPEPASDD